MKLVKSWWEVWLEGDWNRTKVRVDNRDKAKALAAERMAQDDLRQWIIGRVRKFDDGQVWRCSTMRRVKGVWRRCTTLEANPNATVSPVYFEDNEVGCTSPNVPAPRACSPLDWRDHRKEV